MVYGYWLKIFVAVWYCLVVDLLDCFIIIGGCYCNCIEYALWIF